MPFNLISKQSGIGKSKQFLKDIPTS